jgi:hypothetical protein
MFGQVMMQYLESEATGNSLLPGGGLQETGESELPAALGNVMNATIAKGTEDGEERLVHHKKKKPKEEQKKNNC